MVFDNSDSHIEDTVTGSDDILNCEFEGVIGTTASVVGTTQANEALKMIMEIGQNLKNQILIIDLLNLNFRKVKFKK